MALHKNIFSLAVYILNLSRGNGKYISSVSEYKLPVPVPKVQHLTSSSAGKTSKLGVKDLAARSKEEGSRSERSLGIWCLMGWLLGKHYKRNLSATSIESHRNMFMFGY